MSPAAPAPIPQDIRSAHRLPTRPGRGGLRRLALASALGLALTGLLLTPTAQAQGGTQAGRGASIQIPLSGDGIAAVYSDKLHGRKTASGVKYDRNKLTAAHKTLPFGTRVRLTFEKSGKSAVVTINDRGPHQPDREFDLSRASAIALGMKPVSLERVHYQILN